MVKSLRSYRQVQIHTLIDDNLKIIFRVERKLSGYFEMSYTNVLETSNRYFLMFHSVVLHYVIFLTVI